MTLMDMKMIYSITPLVVSLDTACPFVTPFQQEEVTE
jgi:hypothetical protein